MPVLPAKLRELFRNLKSDAVPRSPRPETEETIHDVTEDNDENVDTSNEQEEIFVEPEDFKKGEKQKFKNYNETKKNGNGFPKFGKADKKNKGHGVGHSVNTQATGNVINIVGTRDFHWGNVFINHFGSTNDNQKPTNPEDNIKECNLITLVKEAKITPDHDYIDFISKNLGKNWQSFFRKLGYKQGRIETFVLQYEKYGIEEARYKLLLDWVHNDDIGTLGHLATILWDEGERALVKDLALIYRTNNKNAC